MNLKKREEHSKGYTFSKVDKNLLNCYIFISNGTVRTQFNDNHKTIQFSKSL